MFIATDKQKARLTRASKPVTDPLAQNYAAWRRSMLLRVLFWSLVPTLLGIASGFFELDNNDNQQSDEALLEPSERSAKDILAYISLSLLPLHVLFLVLAAWKWHRVRWSRCLACWAWICWFFFPVPLLLIPSQLVVSEQGMHRWNDAAASMSHIWLSFLSALFGLIPGVLRGGLVLRQLIPESQLPGRLIILAAPFCSVVYLLTLSVGLQFSANSYLIAGMSLLAAAPLVCWTRRSGLLRRDTMCGAHRTVRWIHWIQTTLTAAGLVLLLRFFWDVPMLSSLLGKLNVSWFLELLARTLANRALFTVVICDYVLTLLYSSQALRQTPAGKELEQKIACIGEAISG